MNYSDLQAKVSGLLNRRDATPTQIQGWIQDSIQRIQRELRCPAMEQVVDVTIGSYSLPYPGLPIPSDLLELIDLLDHHGNRITKEDVSRVSYLSREASVPRYYYRLAGRWLLGPAPQVGHTIRIVYYAEIGALVNPTDENVITDIAPDLISYGALSYAGDFFVDKRTSQWESRYSQIIQAIQGMADADELSGGSAVSPAYDWPSDDMWGYGGGY